MVEGMQRSKQMSCYFPYNIIFNTRFTIVDNQVLKIQNSTTKTFRKQSCLIKKVDSYAM